MYLYIYIFFFPIFELVVIPTLTNLYPKHPWAHVVPILTRSCPHRSPGCWYHAIRHRWVHHWLRHRMKHGTNHAVALQGRRLRLRLRSCTGILQMPGPGGNWCQQMCHGQDMGFHRLYIYDFICIHHEIYEYIYAYIILYEHKVQHIHIIIFSIYIYINIYLFIYLSIYLDF